MNIAWSKSQVKIANWIIRFILFFLLLSIIVAIISFVMFGKIGYGFPLIRLVTAAYFAHRFNDKFNILKAKDNGNF